MRSAIEDAAFRKRREALRSTGPVTPQREASSSERLKLMVEEVQAADPQTATDRTREQMTNDERRAELARDFEQRGAEASGRHRRGQSCVKACGSASNLTS